MALNQLARSTVTQQKLVANFNATFPVGTKVRYWTGVREGLGKESTTRSDAKLIGGHAAVIWLDGVSGCVALSHVEPIL